MICHKKILFLGAHSDDEMGCCGSLLKFINMGNDIHTAIFSFCEESVPHPYPKDILYHENFEAMNKLGVPLSNRNDFTFAVRHFPEHRQQILEILINLKNKINPDLVFLPMLEDIHQDHHVIAMEGVRAFKNSSILGYELIHNNLSSKNAVFIELSEKDIKDKIEIIKCYQSQKNKLYSFEDFIVSLAKIRGVQAGVRYAESFEAIRIISKL